MSSFDELPKDVQTIRVDFSQEETTELTERDCRLFAITKWVIEHPSLPCVIGPKGCKERLIKEGFIFTGELTNDELFEFVIFPAGWEFRFVCNPAYLHLFDEHNRLRFILQVSLTSTMPEIELIGVPRFKLTTIYLPRPIVQIRDDQDVVKSISLGRVLPLASDALVEKIATRMAVKKLNHSYPHWRNPCAYWDLDLM